MRESVRSMTVIEFTFKICIVKKEREKTRLWKSETSRWTAQVPKRLALTLPKQNTFCALFFFSSARLLLQEMYIAPCTRFRLMLTSLRLPNPKRHTPRVVKHSWARRCLEQTLPANIAVRGIFFFFFQICCVRFRSPKYCKQRSNETAPHCSRRLAIVDLCVKICAQNANSKVSSKACATASDNARIFEKHAYKSRCAVPLDRSFVRRFQYPLNKRRGPTSLVCARSFT